MAGLTLRTRRLLARGINPRRAGRYGSAIFVSQPTTIGNRATKVVGSGNAAFAIHAKEPGTGGNAVTVAFVAPASANSPLSVSVAGKAITVNLRTVTASTPVSTAAEVRRAINSDPSAQKLVHAQSVPGSDGTGVVTAAASSNLTGAT